MTDAEAPGRIVLGVDGSPGSRRAAEWAVAEARRRGAELEAVFVWQPPGFLSGDSGFDPLPADEVDRTGNAMIAGAMGARAGRAGVKVHQRVVKGRASDVLRRAASEPGVVLLVVGTRGHGGITPAALGSVSHALAHRPPVPLVVVPPRRASTTGQAPEARIVVGLDGSEAAVAALGWALTEARLRGATLETVTAWYLRPSDYPLFFPGFISVVGEIEEAAHRLNDAALARVGPAGVAVERVVREGRAASVLVHEAAVAQLLVVGVSVPPPLRQAMLGSTGEACLHRAPVPVVLVPEPAAEAVTP